MTVGKAILDGMDDIKRWLLLNLRIIFGLIITLIAAAYLGYGFEDYPKRQAERFQSLDVSRQLENCKLVPLTTKEIFDIENESRKTMAQIFGGLFILIGIFFAYKRQTTAEETLRVTERGQITDRFTKAIEQLGNKEQLELRLGAIYALEKIAHDSADYHWQVMEILTAYVRSGFSWKESAEPKRGDEVPLDLEAVMTVLRRRKHEREIKAQRIDLSRSDLRNVNLNDANLQRALFLAANLQMAHLIGAKLQGARFHYAILQGAFFDSCDLRQTEGLTQGQIDLTNCNTSTILPEGLNNTKSLESLKLYGNN